MMTLKAADHEISGLSARNPTQERTFFASRDAEKDALASRHYKFCREFL